MTKINSYILYLVLVASGMLASSCESDFLDKQPDDMLTLEQVFSNRIETERYLRNVYSHLPHEIDIFANFSGVSDEGDMVWSTVQSNNINSGNWSPVAIPYDNFGYYYRGIRSASVFINNVDQCKDCEDYVPESTTVWKAEARSLRAWYYFLLLRKYGPVVLLKEMLPVDTDLPATQIPRSSFDESVDYIISELEQAQLNLPFEITETSEFGKVDQRVVQAMKSRIFLYAASPLWNGNADYANFQNSDGKQLVNTTYDVNKWRKAAEASKALIDMMPVGLFEVIPEGSSTPDPFLSYRNLFFERWNKEVIWARPGSGGSIGWEIHSAPRQVNGYNGNSVTQQQVDAYHMANGKLINEAGSGYVESGFSTANTTYTRAGDWNMYVDREPRFYATVLYNGDIWPFTKNGAIKVELYNTGRSGKAGSHDYSPTGYLNIKFSSPNTDVVNGQYVQQAYIFFRLAEIYLNYAEALNECDPGNPDIAYYVNKVRERGGIPALPTGLSQDQMRERIRHERRIELAFESHRMWDTRRWKIAEATDGGPMWGMNVSQGTSFTDPSFYERTVFENRVFNQKHYLWPIPQSEMDRNKAMVQNPGW